MNLVAPRSEIAPGCKLEPGDVVNGYDHWELREKYDRSITPETFRLLREKYPERRHFGYDGITVLLAKPEKAVSSGAV
jgi:hypothetical protein